MNDLKCASFFAGVGGIDLGFKQAGNSVCVPVIKRIAEKIDAATQEDKQ